MADASERKKKKFSNVFAMEYGTDDEGRPPQAYYDSIKEKFAAERDLRLGYRPPGTDIYEAAEGALEEGGHPFASLLRGPKTRDQLGGLALVEADLAAPRQHER